MKHVLYSRQMAENGIAEKTIGKRVIDISGLVDSFEADEGTIEQIIGKTGNGKTYEATRRAYNYLRQGYVVYTTWQLILPEYYDEREQVGSLIWRTLTFKKRFYRFPLKQNWHFIDIYRSDLKEYISSLTDCIVMLDEGQDIFDARERADQSARQTLTRTRHLRRTLIIISQRAQAVDVTARANVTFFYQCIKKRFLFWNRFKILRTEDMDSSNYPIWHIEGTETKPDWDAEVYYSAFAKKHIYDMYNSWYLRGGIPRSQDIYFEAYDLSTLSKFKAFFIALFTKRKPIVENVEAYNAPMVNLKMQGLKASYDNPLSGHNVVFVPDNKGIFSEELSTGKPSLMSKLPVKRARKKIQ